MMNLTGHEAGNGGNSQGTSTARCAFLYSEKSPGLLGQLRSFPRAVRIDIGHALFTAQQGRTDPGAKPLKGFGGASVLEIVASHHGNAWRAVYTVRFQDAIHVLHVFQKKSTKGIATAAREIDLIKQRLAEVERDHRERQN